tara:strand:- start:421 stop:645 length:225 start_codon:yes stop_codon:yes gene_type:complete
MSKFELGHRVTNQIDGRDGFVVSAPYNKLVPVAIEQSTRKELWPETQVLMKPQDEQLVAMGGNYNAPPGFPLNI